VEFRAVPYEEMPAVFASASSMVLASIATASGGYFLGDIPRFFWEEQFGLVLAEAMATGLPIIASQSGAIPEVCGDEAAFFLPGDWLGLARRLAEGPLSQPPGAGSKTPSRFAERYSTRVTADHLAEVYERLLS
jgi:glycosyltransferase involved in cell wall biosynthesis